MNTNNISATDLAIIEKTALAKLNRSLAKTDLDDLLVGARRSLLLVDCSGSMADSIRGGERKIDALRKVVDSLRADRPTPLAAFGLHTREEVAVVDSVPEPQGGTPLHLAIDFGKQQGANHLVVVTDGEANDEGMAFDAARRFGGRIDVFYIGNEGTRGARFAAELAKMTGGDCGLTDLVGSPKVLAGKILLALGDGSGI